MGGTLYNGLNPTAIANEVTQSHERIAVNAMYAYSMRMAIRFLEEAARAVVRFSMRCLLVAALLTALPFLVVPALAGADIYQYESPDGTLYFTNAPMAKKGTVIVKEKKAAPQKKAEAKPVSAKKPAAPSHASKETYRDVAEEKALQHNLDPELVKAVIKNESNWNPQAVSHKGAKGLMQLMPGTAYDLGVSNPFNPEENIDGGVRYLRQMVDRFDGDLSRALAAYNAGPARVEKSNGVPPIAETQHYVRKVLNDYSGPGAVSLNPRSKPIRRVVLADGTLLFTNSSLSSSHHIR